MYLNWEEIKYTVQCAVWRYQFAWMCLQTQIRARGELR